MAKKKTKKKTTAKKKKKVDDSRKLPRSPEYKMAQQSLVRSNVLNLVGEQGRVQEVLRGTLGMRKLRSAGTSMFGYGIRKPKGDKGWKKYA